MRYTYVRVELDNFAAGSAKSSDHRKVIDEYAAKGYRYAGFVPVQFGPSGKMLAMDLVLERAE